MQQQKKISEMTKEEYRIYNRKKQARFRQRQKDLIAQLTEENERLKAELADVRGGKAV